LPPWSIRENQQSAPAPGELRYSDLPQQDESKTRPLLLVAHFDISLNGARALGGIGDANVSATLTRARVPACLPSSILTSWRLDLSVARSLRFAGLSVKAIRRVDWVCAAWEPLRTAWDGMSTAAQLQRNPGCGLRDRSGVTSQHSDLRARAVRTEARLRPPSGETKVSRFSAVAAAFRFARASLPDGRLGRLVEFDGAGDEGGIAGECQSGQFARCGSGAEAAAPYARAASAQNYGAGRRSPS
jgi:hypothetical protein